MTKPIPPSKVWREPCAPRVSLQAAMSSDGLEALSALDPPASRAGPAQD